MYWKLGEDPIEVATEPPHSERTRHSRKYTEGNLGQERSFFFRGREGKLKLKAHNLNLFMHIADGIDDDTWTFHLHRGDYSRWLRVEVKDAGLADAVVAIETNKKLTPDESRARVRSAIEQRYTLPSDKASGLIDPPPTKRAQA
jgi:hypothetical protein